MKMMTYQDYTSYSKIEKVKVELDEIKEIMIKNIELILQRGEKLDDLVKKSHDLSMQSRQFYKASKKSDSCCSIM